MLNIREVYDVHNVIENVEIGWFHRYPARFSDEVLKHIFIKIYQKLGRFPSNVLDPFAGTGSTISFAKQLGIPSFGKELTALGTLICNVRLNPPENLDTALAIAEKLVEDPYTGNYKNINHELIEWIGEENAAYLDYLITEISTINDIRLKNWLQLALSSAIRSSSKWLPGSIKPQIDPNRKYSNLKNHFIRVSRILRKDCIKELSRFKSQCPAEIFEGDSRCIELEDELIDAIITSPPYVSMYDYFDIHRLSYLAFNWNKPHNLQIGRSKKIKKNDVGFTPPPSMEKWYYEEFRGENTIEGRALRAYFEDMKMHFKEVYRILKINGIVAYAVANSIKKGKKFLLVEALAEILKSVGFKEIEIHPRKTSKKKILPVNRNIKTGRFDPNAKPIIKEFIIYARKR